MFGDIHVDERPFSCPCLDRDEKSDKYKLNLEVGHMPENIELMISSLREWRSDFCKCVKNSGNIGESGTSSEAFKAKKRKSGPGSLTKKEQKRVASNWERLKANLSR